MPTKENTLQEKLIRIQRELHAPKSQKNNFAGYQYRSAEQIYEAVKPLLEKEGCLLVVSDELVLIGERYYVKATATISDGEESISTSAYAREQATQKGLSDPQITGGCASYSRKYCLCGMFLLDDNKEEIQPAIDPDRLPPEEEAPKPKAKKSTAKAEKATERTMEEEASEEQKKNLANGCVVAGVPRQWVIDQVGAVPGHMTVSQYNKAMQLVNEVIATNEKEGK